MTLKQLKRVLLERDITISTLARQLGVARYSIYGAIKNGNRPRVLKRIHSFCSRGRAA